MIEEAVTVAVATVVVDVEGLCTEKYNRTADLRGFGNPAGLRIPKTFVQILNFPFLMFPGMKIASQK
ncbi:MAG: hypothetical protein GY795_16505 [Desulfobacterales bacterium]|nr:hypothetical protein [Desulfobacterales bacterium]